MRLAARVFELRKLGYPISSHQYRVTAGDRTKVALYVLEDA
jgi:hypothetical protein